MREIKFRAWDKTRNIYGEVLEIGWPGTFANGDENFPNGHAGRLKLFNINNEDDCGFWGIWIEKADIEQFTGLKDKNGTAIYEGDIVSLNGIPLRIIYQGPSFIMIKKLKDKQWCEFILSAEQNQFCEVIGNIHENSELMNTKRKS
jgi:uncharacterized phage protein (TIGR01671 family)